MHTGNVLRYAVDKSFSQASPGVNERRFWKRRAHKIERKAVRMDLRKGNEIRGTRPITCLFV
jgi:hypothetical protein